MALLGGKFLLEQPIAFEDGTVSIGNFSTTIDPTATSAISVGSSNTTGAASTNAVSVGNQIVVGASCLFSVNVGLALTLDPDFRHTILMGDNNAVSSPGGGDTNILLGNELSVSDAADIISRNILMGRASTSAGTNTVLVGFSNVTGKCTNSISIGSDNRVDDLCSYVACLGFNNNIVAPAGYSVVLGYVCAAHGQDSVIIGNACATIRTSTSTGTSSDVVLLGNTVTAANGASYVVAIGRSLTCVRNNLTGPDAMHTVLVGDQLLATIDYINVVSLGSTNTISGAGGDTVVAIGNNLAQQGDASTKIVLIGANLSVTNQSHVVGLGDNNVAAGNLGDCSWTVMVGFNIVCEGSHSIAMGTASTVGAASTYCLALLGGVVPPGSTGACVIGATATPVHTLAIRGNNSGAIDTVAITDAPTSGNTGLTVAYNDGVSTANKVIAAAASPPPGSLLLYVAP